MNGESRYEQWLEVIERLERDAKNFEYGERYPADYTRSKRGAALITKWRYENTWANSWEEVVWALCSR